MNAPVILNRRHVLAGGGALIVSFSLTRAFAQEKAAAPAHSLPPSLKTAPTTRPPCCARTAPLATVVRPS